MLGLIGLFGALFAGMMTDTAAVHKDPSGGGPDADARPDEPPEDTSGRPDLLDEPADVIASVTADGPSYGSSQDDTAGMPQSDDIEDPPDAALDLSGGDEDDILAGDDGDDTIDGGAGNDQLGGRGGDDSLAGEDGSDYLHGGGGDDSLTGGAGADVLRGEGGADLVEGGTGDDLLCGHSGDDLLSGDEGADTLLGGDGLDTLQGGAGDDDLSGGFGDDQLDGGTGSDELDGGEGNDTIWGQQGDETGDDADFLNGGAGDDVLMLGSSDHGNGGEGADTFTLHTFHTGDSVAQISDFNPSEDDLVVYYDAALHPSPLLTLEPGEDSQSSTLLLDGVPLLSLTNSPGLDLGAIVLRAA